MKDCSHKRLRGSAHSLAIGPFSVEWPGNDNRIYAQRVYPSQKSRCWAPQRSGFKKRFRSWKLERWAAGRAFFFCKIACGKLICDRKNLQCSGILASTERVSYSLRMASRGPPSCRAEAGMWFREVAEYLSNNETYLTYKNFIDNLFPLGLLMCVVIDGH